MCARILNFRNVWACGNKQQQTAPLPANNGCKKKSSACWPSLVANATWQSAAGIYHLVKRGDYEALWEPTWEMYAGTPE